MNPPQAEQRRAYPPESIPAESHPREIDRLTSLCGLHLDMVEAEPLFDEIARQAAELCKAPFAVVSLVREHEQVLMGNVGMAAGGSDREEAICAHTILEREALVVPDLREDARFAGLGIVAGPPYMRFYAGAPVFDNEGLPLGTVCVLDVIARDLTSGPLFALKRLALVAGVMLEGRRLVASLLGTSPHPVALHKALARMDGVFEPLVGRANRYRLGDT